jgi:hypothetical protein
VIICTVLFTASAAFATDPSAKLDFNGDGRTDIAVYREGSRNPMLAPQASYWHFMDTFSQIDTTVRWGQTLDVPAPADYDGDGKTDVAVFRWWDFATGDTNQWWFYNSSTETHSVIHLAYELGYHKFSRNYIGDARAEVGLLYQVNISPNPGETCFLSVYFVTDREVENTIRKTVGEVCNSIPTPIPGDYNNDGRSEIAVFANNTFKVWLPPYGPAYTPPDMTATLDVDMPVPGDYDGDGKTDFAGVKAVDGRLRWRILMSGSSKLFELDWGYSTDKPVAGDYDGDGTTDIAVFRAPEATWWIRNSSNGTMSGFYFGMPTDTPLAMPVIPFNPIS